MNVEMTIIWHVGKPIAFWFGEQLIWEAKKIISEVDFLDIKISLPLVEAVSFSFIFIQGLAVERLATLLVAIQAKIGELKAMRIEAELDKENDNILENEDW